MHLRFAKALRKSHFHCQSQIHGLWTCTRVVGEAGCWSVPPPSNFAAWTQPAQDSTGSHLNQRRVRNSCETFKSSLPMISFLWIAPFLYHSNYIKLAAEALGQMLQMEWDAKCLTNRLHQASDVSSCARLVTFDDGLCNFYVRQIELSIFDMKRKCHGKPLIACFESQGVLQGKWNRYNAIS